MRRVPEKDRPWVITLSMLIVALCSATAGAQDFDADSVFYTPLSRPVPGAPKVKQPARIFYDTTLAHKLVGYYFDLNMGVLTGCNNCVAASTISATTTHGITLGRKLRLGAGIGVDTYYEWIVMPMYGLVNFDLLGTKNTHAVFIQGLYGGGPAWYKTTEFGSVPNEVKGGTMFSALMGYRIPYHDLRISIAGGFKQQSTSLAYESEGWMGPPVRTTIATELRRAVIAFTLTWK